MYVDCIEKSQNLTLEGLVWVVTPELRHLKTLRKWEDVTHQLLSLESIPAGTCPLDNCFKFGKQVSFT